MTPDQFAVELEVCSKLSRSKRCSARQIASLERRHHVTLPEGYKRFLRKAGTSAKSLWVGSDFTFSRLDDIQEAAKELLAAASLELPPNAFVVFMHQGYQFCFVCPSGVFYFHEGETEYRKQFQSFSDLFAATAEKW